VTVWHSFLSSLACDQRLPHSCARTRATRHEDAIQLGHNSTARQVGDSWEICRRVPENEGLELSAAHCAVDTACGDLPSYSDKLRVVIDFILHFCKKISAQASKVGDMASAGVSSGSIF
jgi:hypothetical protein